VDLVTLENVEESISTRDSTSPELSKLIAEAAKTSTGALQLRANPKDNQTYLLIKRSPNTDLAKFGLALTINGSDLIATDSDFWNTSSIQHSLSLPTGSLIAGGLAGTKASYSKALSSISQPLNLSVWASTSWSSLLPWRKVLMIIGLVSLCYFLLSLILTQFLRARTAEREARLNAQETRLAHASRVNALGEMASGLAHELTQPLTAILSQAQAGKHLKSKGEISALDSVLDDTITQAKRASAILERMRQWTKPERKTSSIASVSEAARVVEALMSADAKRLGIEVSFLQADSAETIVAADSVQVEQVIFNLVRNAMDAVSDTKTKSVNVVISKEPGFVVLEVSDSGNGVSEELKDRLFEPFVTSKRDGTGLGLALCQRLVEQAGGELALLEKRKITTFQARLPLASRPVGASKR